MVVVTLDGKLAYDETFHQGINIIRGQNSSGKSTIVRFIFYVLGGCYSDFVPEALQCRFVLAEVEASGTILTLKRNLDRADDGRVINKSPMNIYFGSLADVIESVTSSFINFKQVDWQKYGYFTTSERRSFSNVLFEALGLPEFKAESNITMHQILRLIYLDQESPLSSLFFFDSFDKEIIRETVAELLMGLYDEKLSEAKLRQIEVRKRLDEVRQSIRITGDFLSDPTLKSPAYINEKIEILTKEMREISDEVIRLRHQGSTPQPLANSKKQTLEYQRLQAHIAHLRSQFIKVDNAVTRLKADIQDSHFFLDYLRQKIEAIDRSIATRDYFGTLHLEFCPECLTKIDADVPEGHCRLCKSPIDNTRGRSQAMRIRLELEAQIRESQTLLSKSETELQRQQDEQRSLHRQLTAAQKQYDASVSNVRTTSEERIDQLLQEKGFKEGEIIQYRSFLESAEKYERLIKEQAELRKQDDELTRYIEAAERQIKTERTKIEAAITANGVYLLQNDQDRQAEFRNATDFSLDFKQNMAYLNDRHIKLSASSSFYLKMTARFALFFASLQNPTMMYPRLLFSDNMEDKGMEEERAHNFQRIVVRHLSQYSVSDYQLIFATSMLAPELDKPAYTVGDNYTQNNKSLKNV